MTHEQVVVVVEQMQHQRAEDYSTIRDLQSLVVTNQLIFGEQLGQLSGCVLELRTSVTELRELVSQLLTLVRK